MDRAQGLGYARDCDASTIDYKALADWCRERRGQTIVCEQSGAKLLPFRHLRWARDSIGNKAAEVVWLNPEGQMPLIEDEFVAGNQTPHSIVLSPAARTSVTT